MLEETQRPFFGTANVHWRPMLCRCPQETGGNMDIACAHCNGINEIGSQQGIINCVHCGEPMAAVVIMSPEQAEEIKTAPDGEIVPLETWRDRTPLL